MDNKIDILKEALLQFDPSLTDKAADCVVADICDNVDFDDPYTARHDLQWIAAKFYESHYLRAPWNDEPEDVEQAAQLSAAIAALESTRAGCPRQSIVYCGPDRTGILDCIARAVIQRGITCLQITAADDDLLEALIEMGKAAARSGDAVCVVVEDIHRLPKGEIIELCTNLHRCNQLRLPVIMFCAGSPEIRKIIGGACPYGERLFRFEEVCNDVPLHHTCG